MIALPRSKLLSSVVFLDDGKYVVGGGFEGTLQRWATDDGRETGQPIKASRDDKVLCLAACRDGTRIVSAWENGLVVVWNTTTHSKVHQFSPHPDYAVEVVDVSPDGTRIATGAHDSTICVWSFSGKRLLGPLKHRFTPVAVKYSRDGRLLATVTRLRHSIRIYDSLSGHLFVDIPIEVDGHDQSLASRPPP